MPINADHAIAAATITVAIFAALFVVVRVAAYRARQDAVARHAELAAGRTEAPRGRFITDEPEAQQLDAA